MRHTTAQQRAPLLCRIVKQVGTQAKAAVRGTASSDDAGPQVAILHRLNFAALQEEGLVNEDEWSQILSNEAFGMPRYLTVMYWVEARAPLWQLCAHRLRNVLPVCACGVRGRCLLHRCIRSASGSYHVACINSLCTSHHSPAPFHSRRMARADACMCHMQTLLHQCHAASYIVGPGPILASMLDQVSAIIDSANTVFTFIRCQLPYPYVHLVSFIVHFYLFFWATYTGCMLFAGVPDGGVSSSAQVDVSRFDGTLTIRKATVRAPSCARAVRARHCACWTPAAHSAFL
jgi:hypothetical protein